ncbi:16S rRNA (cytidine(1402)-2'-O)-methyltransferase [Ureaplasma diversum]|uniref:Ribosomal RNA small subunit methyltransferase I n=1 Tax=Ureaplasma diversum NCTC 246 TaxID=1188241 RepID=A0A084EZ84_9BACT|nr:16S rRNA (cytidine(1402)-2'-O)-methyltransferase [Ureaplasma diversum]KEZ23276.1 Hypothetical protein, putative tetrapyrrole methylase family protein [Ureaplasma diversum NCTC 246]
MKLNEKEHILSVVATPIGNINEASARVINTLNEAYVILCEDTRVTAKLLHLLNIFDYKKLISFHNFNEESKINEALKWITSHKTVLVSDAGYPTISDPGYGLIQACHENNIGIEVINGPSSVMHALVASGFCSTSFMFLGFLGKTSNQRKTRLNEIKNVNTTFVVFEAVHRIQKTLADILEVLGDVVVFIGRELTKKNETHYIGRISSIPEIFEKGEFVIVIDYNNPVSVEQEELINEQNLIEQIQIYMHTHQVKLKQACKEVAKIINGSASELYYLMVKKDVK